MKKRDLDDLNDLQKKSVEFPLQPLLVIAGAGTGKTKVISERFLHIVNNFHKDPSRILTITFTNKATDEMLDRIEPRLNKYSDLWITNFHKFGDRVLRESGIDIDISPNFSVFGLKDITFLVEKNIKNFNFNIFLSHSNPNKSISRLIPSFEKMNELLISPEKYQKIVENFNFENFSNQFKSSSKKDLDLELAYKIEISKMKEFSEIYFEYENFKLEKNILSISDLISKTIKLFEEKPNILLHFRNKFDACLVDEFQDTNYGQNRLIELLFPPKDSPITIVGDDKQAIYGFRGSTIKNILEFPKKYNATTIFLDQNYRSNQGILNLAHSISQNSKFETLDKISNNKTSLISATDQNKDYKPKLLEFETFSEESQQISLKIKALIEEGVEPEQIAVLSFANRELEYINSELENLKITTNFNSTQKYSFFSNNVVNLFISFLRVSLFNSNQDMLGLLVNPLLNLDKNKILDLFVNAEKSESSLLEDILKSENSLIKYDEIIDIGKKCKELSKKESLSDATIFLLNDIPYFKNIILNSDEKNLVYVNSIQSIVSEIKKFLEKFPFQNSIVHFLDYIGALKIERGEVINTEISDMDFLENENSIESKGVNLLTIHKSKGLEFDYVFLINATKQKEKSTEKIYLLPQSENLENQEDEKRRIFYVGVTRAKKSLEISWSKKHPDLKKEQKAIEFIEESKDKFEILEEKSILKNLTAHIVIPFQNTKNDFTIDRTSVLKQKNFSHSKIDTFKICPKKFYFKYIKNISEGEKKEVLFGSVLHNTILNLNKGYQETKKFDIEKGENYLKFALKNLTGNILLFEKGVFAINKYIKEFYEKEMEIMYVEESFSKNFGDFIFEGRIDLIAKIKDKISIIDFKTKEEAKNWISKTDVEFEKNNKEQIQEYFLLFPEAENGILWEITTDIPNAILEISKPDNIEDSIRKIIEEIKSSNFLATPDKFTCQFCPFKEICKEGRNMIQKIE